MAHLIKIGNSQGLRIPKPLIHQAGLENKELKFQVINGGLFVTPVRKCRHGWKEAIEKTMIAHGRDETDSEWLDAELTADSDWEW